MAISVAAPKQKKDPFDQMMGVVGAVSSVQNIQSGAAPQGEAADQGASQKAAMDRRLAKKDKMIYGDY